MGHKWVICGSHPDCSVGQWVKRVNRCDPLSTLTAIFLQGIIAFSISSRKIFLRVLILKVITPCKSMVVWPRKTKQNIRGCSLSSTLVPLPMDDNVLRMYYTHMVATCNHDTSFPGSDVRSCCDKN